MRRGSDGWLSLCNGFISTSPNSKGRELKSSNGRVVKEPALVSSSISGPNRSGVSKSVKVMLLRNKEDARRPLFLPLFLLIRITLPTSLSIKLLSASVAVGPSLKTRCRNQCARRSRLSEILGAPDVFFMVLRLLEIIMSK